MWHRIIFGYLAISSCALVLLHSAGVIKEKELLLCLLMLNPLIFGITVEYFIYPVIDLLTPERTAGDERRF